MKRTKNDFVFIKTSSNIKTQNVNIKKYNLIWTNSRNVIKYDNCINRILNKMKFKIIIMPKYNTKKLSLCHKLEFSNSYIFFYLKCTPLIFQT